MTTYEEQLNLVRNLPQSAAESGREITWGLTHNVIGLAKSPQGNIEIFLPGARLEPRSRRIRTVLEYQRWFRSGGEELLANRILLPPAGHYEQVAAFLTTELARNGAATDLAKAFLRTEPLIELAIEELSLAEESLLGLCGEMLVLHALLRSAPAAHTRALVESWKGYRQTPRDFQFGRLGIEVKTTTGTASSHLFSGVHQLEIGHGVDGVPEHAYFLVSLGVSWVGGEGLADSTSLPDLVDRILGRVDESLGAAGSDVADNLIARISTYGAACGLGYHHRTTHTNPRFRRPFRLAFARSYDMSDDSIELFSTEELRQRPYIDIDSLRLRVNFPARVRGDVNPMNGLSQFATHVAALESN